MKRARTHGSVANDRRAMKRLRVELLAGEAVRRRLAEEKYQTHGKMAVAKDAEERETAAAKDMEEREASAAPKKAAAAASKGGGGGTEGGGKAGGGAGGKGGCSGGEARRRRRRQQRTGEPGRRRTAAASACTGGCSFATEEAVHVLALVAAAALRRFVSHPVRVNCVLAALCGWWVGCG